MPRNKLAPHQVAEIRSRLASSSDALLADNYGVCAATIGNIRHGRSHRSFSEKFWSALDRASGDCWTWSKFRSPDGYGICGTGRRSGRALAHRMAWCLHHGISLDELGETCVLHHCDNPPCCNPAHLFLGNRLDNIQDMRRKGRNRSPDPMKAWTRKLTPDAVREIRRKYDGGLAGVNQLAKEYGVGNPHISRLVRRMTWRSVP